MSKAILVMDMPEKCKDCILHEMAGDFNKHLCVPMQRTHDKFSNTKPDWCPLKELPEKYDLNEEFTYEDMWDADEKWAFENGYNTCLKEILGE